MLTYCCICVFYFLSKLTEFLETRTNTYTSPYHKPLKFLCLIFLWFSGVLSILSFIFDCILLCENPFSLVYTFSTRSLMERPSSLDTLLYRKGLYYYQCVMTRSSEQVLSFFIESLICFHFMNRVWTKIKQELHTLVEYKKFLVKGQIQTLPVQTFSRVCKLVFEEKKQ